MCSGVYLRDLLELFRCLWARVLVWMVFEGRLSVSFLEVALGHAGLDAQYVVVLGLLHHRAILLATATSIKLSTKITI